MDGKTILSDTPERLVRKFRKSLEKKGVPVEQIILFGSWATNSAKPWSDIDVCVVSKRFGKNGYDEMVFLSQVASQIEPMIEPHPYHPRDLASPYDPLAYEIRTHGKPV